MPQASEQQHRTEKTAPALPPRPVHDIRPPTRPPTASRTSTSTSPRPPTGPVPSQSPSDRARRRHALSALCDPLPPPPRVQLTGLAPAPAYPHIPYPHSPTGRRRKTKYNNRERDEDGTSTDQDEIDPRSSMTPEDRTYHEPDPRPSMTPDCDHNTHQLLRRRNQLRHATFVSLSQHRPHHQYTGKGRIRARRHR